MKPGVAQAHALSLGERLAAAAYGGLCAAAGPLLRRKLARRGRAEPGYLEAVEERFGRHDGPPPEPGALWLHAVSLGETRAAAPLVAALRAARPGLRLILTHGTATGRAAGAGLLQPGDRQAWLPWDAPGPVARFLDWARPGAGVLLETEVWPGLMAGAAARGLPVWLANARLSARSLRRARPWALLLRPAYRALAGALAQTAEDAARLQQAGVRRVEVLGNLKHAMQADPGQRARGAAWAAASGQPLILLASSREGEEDALLAAWPASPLAGRARLLLVPRHPQRFEAVAAALAAAGPWARRSAWAAAVPTAEVLAPGVAWLGDSLGEMPAYAAAAAASGGVALLGGSFGPFGGQNLIELAAAGCPLLLGPHTENFAAAAAGVLAAGGAQRRPDLPAALAAAAAWLDRPAERQRAGEAAAAFAGPAPGVAEAMAARILAGLP